MLDDEEVDLQKAVEESLKDVHTAHQGPLPPVTLKKKSPANQYIFQRRSSASIEPSGHDESSSLYAELGLTNSGTESDEEVPGIDAGDQDEGQAGPNPGIQEEGQAGSNPGDAAVSQPQPSHVVHAGPNLEHMDVEEFSFTNQFLEEKSHEDEHEKTNTELEVQSMVTVPIHQDTSSVPLMTTLVIDLTVSQPVSTTVLAPLPTSIATVTAITTTTSLLPPPTQPQQASSDSILIQRIEVDEIVTDAIDWAIQAPLRDHFRDLPEADMKEILHHRMWESNSYKAHEDHKKLYEALEKSMDTASAKYTAWTTTDTRLKPSVSSIPEDLHIDDDTAPDEQVHMSGDEYIGHDHIPTVNLKQNWWKSLPKDRPATPEPAWSIPSSDFPVPMNNWASALASTYAPPPENSLLAQTGDMAIFMDWFCKEQGITELKQQDLEGPAYEIVKVFHPNVIHLYKPLPLGGPPGQVTIQSDFFFNKDLEYLRYGHKSGRPALSISKMKAAYYPDVGLEQMVPDQMWIEEECKYDIAAIYGKYGDSDGYTFDDPILILEILSRRFLLRGIYLITGSSKDGDGDTSFQWSQFTTQCSHLMFPSKDIMTTE
ncbi:hypothetical protein Tco_0052758 [Tanacetum coccineum]